MKKRKSNRKKLRILAAILCFMLIMTDAAAFASAEPASAGAQQTENSVSAQFDTDNSNIALFEEGREKAAVTADNSNSSEEDIMPIGDDDIAAGEEPGEQEEPQNPENPATESTPSSWAAAEVQLAADNRIITEGQTFEYQTAITRVQYCQIIYNMIQADKVRKGEAVTEGPTKPEQRATDTSADNQTVSKSKSKKPATQKPEQTETVEPESEEPSPYTDTNDKAVIELSKIGIVNGMGDGIFSPDGTLTREQAAAILTRTANYLNIKNPNGKVPVFYDGTRISSWAVQNVKFISAQKSQNGTPVMGGYDSRFDPQGTLTCEQAIISVYRLYDSIPVGDKGDTSWINQHGWLLTEVTLSAAGDCTLGRDHGSAYANSLDAVYDSSGGNAAIFFKNVSQFHNDDVTIVNFEGTLTDSNTPATKRFRFKGRKAYTNILKFGSVDVVNFANNHAHDYLQVGYNDTIKTLKDAGIGVAGYDYIYIKEVKGIKIGFYGLAPMGSGLSADYKSRITRLIRDLKAQGAQYIVGSFHWGVEREYTQNSSQISIAHYAIDSGTDLVLGHHPHVLQGTEIYKGSQIAYSLGNFCFGGNRNPGDKDTAVFQEKIVFDLETGQAVTRNRTFYPYRLSSVTNRNDYQPVPVTGAEASRVYSKLKIK